MGIDDREYMRQREEPPWWRRHRVVTLLCGGIALLVFLLLARAPVSQNRAHDAGWETGTNADVPVPRNCIIDINTASLQELDDLPYISTTVARAIVAGRPYRQVDDLLRVKGIGPRMLERIRPHVSCK